MLDALAQRYSCLPSTVREADALNFRVVALLGAAGKFGELPPPEPVWPQLDDDGLGGLPMELAD